MNPTDENDESRITLNSIGESFNRYALTAGLTLPEFSGKRGEDVFEFLKRFKRATLTFEDDLKCVALNKALVKSASIWAKVNIRELLRSNQWKLVKKKLIERYAPSDLPLKHLEQLRKMSFNPETDGLLSYVEEYVYCYKRAYRNHAENDVVRSVILNLPPKVMLRLNLMATDCKELETVDDLYKAVGRIESHILPYENDTSGDKRVTKEDLKDLMNDIKAVVATRDKTVGEESKEKNPTVAAIGIQQKPVNELVSEPIQQNQTSSRPQFNSNHKRPYRNNYRGKYHNSFNKGGRGRQYNNHEWQTNCQQGNKPSGTCQASLSPLEEAYIKTYGKPPGNCQICNLGLHYNKHCPYKDLKA